jgi:hypothetical protein
MTRTPYGPCSRAALLLALTAASAPTFAEDPIVMFDGFDGCDPVTASIGPEGGELRLCGAQLTVPAGAVAAPTTFGIERLATAPDAPFDMEPAGPAFRFTPGALALDPPAVVRIPREDGRRGGLAQDVPWEGGFVLIEACDQSAGGLQQYFGELGTFGAFRFVGPLPDSTQGLGDGTLTAVADGVQTQYDVDRPGNNYAIYQDSPGGSRQVLVTAMNDLPNGGFEYLRLDLAVNAATGQGSIIQISLLGPVNGSYILGLLGQASISFGDLSDGRIRAQIEANLVNGPQNIPFQAQIDVGVERYIFPPSLSCPEMPPGKR